MLRYFMRQVTVNPTRSDGFLKQINMPFNISKYFQCSFINKTVEDWMNTLPEDKRKRVKLIQNEIALKQAEVKRVPKLHTLNISDYEEMLEISTSRRQRYYEYLFAAKTASSIEDIKSEIRRKVYEDKKEAGTLGSVSNHIEYGLGKNTMLLKVTRKTMMKWRNRKLHRAIMLDDPPLIFDCGFCEEMSKFEIKDTARQIKYSYSENRMSVKPFVMHLCNLDKNSLLWHELKQQIPNIHKMPWKIHSGDASEIFKTENLVYLSPDASEVMEKFNVDDKYIVGSIVDKGNQKPLTLAKSKRLNIRAVRLPLNKYIRFHSHKTLTLDQMTSILIELKKSQNWSKAFKHIPGRKILG